jgi:hypothetical protein
MAGYDGQHILRVDHIQGKFQIHKLTFVGMMKNPNVAWAALIIDTWTRNAFFRTQFNAHDPNIRHDKTKARHGCQVLRPWGEENPIGTIPDFPKAEKEQLDVEIRAHKQVYSKNRYETIPESRYMKSVGKPLKKQDVNIIGSNSFHTFSLFSFYLFFPFLVGLNGIFWKNVGKELANEIFLSPQATR